MLYTFPLITHIPHFHPAISIGHNSPPGKVFLIDRLVCRFTRTEDSPEREDIPILVTMFPPEINLNHQRNPDRSEEGKKEINSRECERCVDSVALRGMNMFSLGSNAVSEFCLPSNSETHPLDDQEEECIVEPVEGKNTDMERDGAKLPSEKNANRQGDDDPGSLV